MTLDPSLDPVLISRAILIWTGKGKTNYPKPDSARLFEAFGAETATRLLPVLEALRRDFFSSNAHSTVRGLAQKSQVAAQEFRQRHPEISDEAVKVLANWYAFQHK